VFLPACFALNMAPGPNNLLSVSNASRYGYRASCVAGVARLAAFALMIILAGTGLAMVLHASERVFYAIKIIGAVYLLYLAYQLWTAAPQLEIESCDTRHGVSSLARQEFLVAIGNPKAVLIFTAFLPQFVNPEADITAQFISLGLLFIVLEWIAISAYAFVGLQLQSWFKTARGKQIFNRCCAGMLSGAASMVLLARRG